MKIGAIALVVALLIVCIALMLGIPYFGTSYWIVGIPIYKVPLNSVKEGPILRILDDGRSVQLSDSEEQAVKSWLTKNKSGWSSSVAWAPPGELYIRLDKITFNFRFANSVVLASFAPKVDGNLVQLSHPLGSGDRETLMKALAINPKASPARK